MSSNSADDLDDALLGKRPSKAALQTAVSIAQAETLITLHELIENELREREDNYGTGACVRIESPSQLTTIRELLGMDPDDLDQ